MRICFFFFFFWGMSHTSGKVPHFRGSTKKAPVEQHGSKRLHISWTWKTIKCANASPVPITTAPENMYFILKLQSQEKNLRLIQFRPLTRSMIQRLYWGKFALPGPIKKKKNQLYLGPISKSKKNMFCLFALYSVYLQINHQWKKKG